jgi:hypothetical protein
VSQTIHESLDAYETLKLSNARAEQQGKDFVKDLGINRKEMMQAASLQRVLSTESSCWLPSVFGIMLIALTISWNNNSFEYETDGYVPGSVYSALSD